MVRGDIVEELKESQILKQYISQYKQVLVMLAVFAVIFCGIFYLYRIEPEAVIYAAGLSALISVPITGMHYLKYSKKHKMLLEIRHSITGIEERRPKASGLIEEDYEKIIQELLTEVKRITNESRLIQNESREYYSIWIHQIKIPISALRLILQEEDTKEYQEMRAELFRIEQYVEMVLSYVRLNSDTSDFIFKKYELDGLIRKTIRKYAAQFVRKKIHIVYEGTIDWILTDEKWFAFILEQVLSNAIKYTDEGTVTISVSQNKILSVQDTGIGIATEDLPRIFENGFTGYNGRTQRKSTGIGLYLCKCAADKLSCPIWAESEPGRGTVIYLDFKMKELDVE